MIARVRQGHIGWSDDIRALALCLLVHSTFPKIRWVILQQISTKQLLYVNFTGEGGTHSGPTLSLPLVVYNLGKDKDKEESDTPINSIVIEKVEEFTVAVIHWYFSNHWRFEKNISVLIRGNYGKGVR